MVVEVGERWNKFVAAFNALGEEMRGMTPAAASVLLVTAAEYENDNTKGYQFLQAGVPGFAAAFSANKVVDVRNDYLDCPEFWAVDINNLRAKITDAGVGYVKEHINVFNILLGVE